jgi:hypothetical protein
MRPARSLVAACTALVLLSLASGCYTMRAQLPGTLRADVGDRDVEVAGRYEIVVRRTYFFWGLLAPSPVERAIADDLPRACARAGADGAANLLFEAHFSPLDWAIATATLGVVTPRSYRVRGDLVRIAAPPPAGKRLLPPRGKRRHARPRRRRR